MIRSTFYGFSTALSGLKASQTAMDVIGQNVSNSNTDGYTRQRVVQTSVVSSTTAEKYGSRTSPIAGQGTKVSSLSQVRDTTLDTRFRTENASLGRYDAELSAMSDIEGIFDEATTSGMRDAILSFQTAFENLSLNTGSDEFDSLTRSAGSYVARLLNQYAQQVKDVYNAELYDFTNGSVSDANGVLKSLAVIDQSILNAEVAGDNPLELYDQRNDLLDQLSSYCDIDYYYEKKVLAPNIITNVLHVSMKQENGQSAELINGINFAQFGVEIDRGELSDGTQHDVTDSATTDRDNDVSISDNQVKLLISGLTDNTEADFDDIKEEYQEKVNEYNTKADQYNLKNGFQEGDAGYRAHKALEDYIVDVTPVYGTDANGLQASNGNAVTNGILFGSLNMLNAAGDYEEGGCTIRGYKYYASALDTLANEMATQMNTQNRDIIYMSDPDDPNKGYALEKVSVETTDNNGTSTSEDLLTGGNEQIYAVLQDDGTYKYGTIQPIDGSVNYEFTELTGQDKDEFDAKMADINANKDTQSLVTDAYSVEKNLFTGYDGVSTDNITAANIGVSNAWLEGTVKVTNSTNYCPDGDDNSGDNLNTLKFVKLFQNDTEFVTGSGITLFTGGYENFLSAVGDTVALDTNTHTTTYDSYSTVVSSIDSDRISVSGVSIDEEAVDIYKYQRAYEAASRVMTALDELLDKLINGTGTVGL